MAKTKIRGITIELDADTNPLVRAFKDAQSSIKSLDNGLKDVNKLLKFDPSNVTLLQQKQQYLNDAIAQTRQQLKYQTEMLNQLPTDPSGRLTDEQMALTREIEATRQKLSGYESDLQDVNKTILGTDKDTQSLAKSTKKASDEAKDGTEGWSAYKQVLADLSTKAITGVLNGLKSLGKQIIELGKSSVEAYSDYEQLKGGIETLYEDSEVIERVLQNANNAFASTGQSANEYMETVIAFSASLKQSAGSVSEAADIADMAMQDMSDNANKLGTSMESIENAYRGFAKQNYTMLDNLALGYGGTKKEMERLLKDAEKLTGIKYDISNLTDVYTAIHVIQTELGITGTTAKEASTTIQGSSKAMKSAWQNVMLAMADDTQDFDHAFDAFTESLETYLGNLLPRIKTVVNGIGKLIDKAIPGFSKTVSQMIDTVIKLTKVIIQNRDVIVGTIATIGSALAGFKLYEVLSSITTLVTPIGATAAALGALAGMIGVISIQGSKLDAATQKIVDSAEQVLANNSKLKSSYDEVAAARQEYINSAMSEVTLQENLWDKLQAIVDENGNVKEGYEQRAAILVNQLNPYLEKEIELTNGSIKNYQKMTDQIDKLIQKKKAEIYLKAEEEAYTEAIRNQTTANENLVATEEELNKIREELNATIAELDQTTNDYYNSTLETGQVTYNAEIDRLRKRKNALEEEVDALETSKKEQEDIVKSYNEDIENYETDFATFMSGDYAAMLNKAGKKTGEDYGEGLKKGLNTKFGEVNTLVEKKATNINDRIRNIFGIHSPSRVMEEFGRLYLEGFEKGLDEEEGSVLRQLASVGAGINDAFGNSLATQSLMTSAGALGTLGGQLVTTNTTNNSPVFNITVNEAESAELTAKMVAQEIQFNVSQNGRVWK